MRLLAKFHFKITISMISMVNKNTLYNKRIEEMATKVITFRVSEEQKDKLKEQANIKNMSISEYVRALVSSEQKCDSSRFQYRHFCNLLTEIQRLKIVYPEVDFEKLEEEVEKIWLC